MNMAEYGSWRSQQPENVHFEPIIGELKSDIFTEAKCKIGFIYEKVSNLMFNAVTMSQQNSDASQEAQKVFFKS